MTVEFQDWSDEYASKAQRTASAITSLCSAVRDLRTATVRKSRSAQDSLSSRRDVCDQLDALSLIVSEGFDKLQISAPLASNRPSAPDLTAEIVRIKEKTSRIQDLILQIRNDAPALSSSGEKVPPAKTARTPGLLQKGAKHFAALAEIFQLQDRFEQRNEHILAGFVTALNVSDKARATVFQVVNAQVNGVAEMTISYLHIADQSAKSLISMEAIAAEMEAQSVRLLAEAVEPVISSIAMPVYELVELCDSTKVGFDLTNHEAASEEADAQDTKRTVSSLEIIDKVTVFADSLRTWHTDLCSVSDSVRLGSSGGSLDGHLAHVVEKIVALKIVATELEQLSSDQSGTSDPSVSVGPDFSIAVNDITSSFTMESERDDHRAAMHRLGLDIPG